MKTSQVVKILSPAKVNLFLEVRPEIIRGDGYHEIETVIQEIDLADRLEIKEKKQGIHIKTDSPILPVGKSNLAYQAARLLKHHCQIKQGVEIVIQKRIPIGAGLGGGSSNAAYTLKGLNRLWRLGLSNIELAFLAAQLGSDVPFFIYGGTALCKGRGEIVFPLQQGKPYSFTYLLVYPGISISTRKIYRNLNLGLTKYPRDVSICINRLCRTTCSDSPVPTCRDRSFGLFNRLEATVLKLYPVIGKIRVKLSQLGLSPVLISGSGSSLFGPVDSRKEAARLESKIRANGLGEVWRAQPCLSCRQAGPMNW